MGTDILTLPCPHEETTKREWFVWRHPSDNLACGILNNSQYKMVADDWFKGKDGQRVLDIQHALADVYEVTALLTPHGLCKLAEWLCEGSDSKSEAEKVKWATRQAKRLAALLVSPIHILVYETFQSRVTNFVTNVGWFAQRPAFGIRPGPYPTSTGVNMWGRQVYQMLPIMQVMEKDQLDSIGKDLVTQFKQAEAEMEKSIRTMNPVSEAWNKAVQVATGKGKKKP